MNRYIILFSLFVHTCAFAVPKSPDLSTENIKSKVVTPSSCHETHEILCEKIVRGNCKLSSDGSLCNCQCELTGEKPVGMDLPTCPEGCRTNITSCGYSAFNKSFQILPSIQCSVNNGCNDPSFHPVISIMCVGNNAANFSETDY